jgi:hypothetical protein
MLLILNYREFEGGILLISGGVLLLLSAIKHPLLKKWLVLFSLISLSLFFGLFSLLEFSDVIKSFLNVSSDDYFLPGLFGILLYEILTIFIYAKFVAKGGRVDRMIYLFSLVYGLLGFLIYLGVDSIDELLHV